MVPSMKETARERIIADRMANQLVSYFNNYRISTVNFRTNFYHTLIMTLSPFKSQIYRCAPLIACLGVISSCHPYQKQIPTGFSIKLENVYANPKYDHSKVNNVLCLPIQNPLRNQQLIFAQNDIKLSLLRNFGKFNYFNIQYPTHMEESMGEVVNLDTGTINRLKLGAIGEQFSTQAILQVSIMDYRPFTPMRLQLKAVLVDCQTGEKVWAADQVFDAQDAHVINGMRIWWNTYVAGGNANQRFSTSMINPSFFIDFALFNLAQSYGDARVKNTEAIDKIKSTLDKAK
ncbi:MAG: hypothetical protein K0S74_405 [Chlamydiales bacterium]|jgi:hypothetical protein|nr:hypothetical protein [Chlamydiales bacterium]